jgi:hypothetical protein
MTREEAEKLDLERRAPNSRPIVHVIERGHNLLSHHGSPKMAHRRRILALPNWAACWGATAIGALACAPRSGSHRDRRPAAPLRRHPRYRLLPLRRSVESRAVAISPIGARRRLRYHSAMAKLYCPSSSTVARHCASRAQVCKRGVQGCAEPNDGSIKVALACN